jgi:hypothetical protein
MIDYLPKTQAAVREEVTFGYFFLTAGIAKETDPSNN